MVLADLDGGLDEIGPERAFADLELEGVEGDAVVVSDDALLLAAEDLGEIAAGDGDEGAAVLRL